MKVFICIRQSYRGKVETPRVTAFSTRSAAQRWASAMALDNKGLAYDVEEVRVLAASKGRPKTVGPAKPAKPAKPRTPKVNAAQPELVI